MDDRGEPNARSSGTARFTRKQKRRPRLETTVRQRLTFVNRTVSTGVPIPPMTVEIGA